jgi:hypothetical protein
MSIFHNDPEVLKRLAQLWKEKPWTRPTPVGLAPTMGYGDRLGLATPGHLLAHTRAGLAGKVVPLFAQQSAREMERIGRTPAEVMWDASFALADSDYRGLCGSDADHMKTEEQVAGCVETGFTFFTADPSALVQEDAGSAAPVEVNRRFVELVERNPGAFDHYLADYARDHKVAGAKGSIPGNPLAVKRVAVIYGLALGRVREIYRWVESRWKGESAFDFEVSVDETSTPTTPLAHLIIARELKRMGLHFTSLAPRFIGEFQKAVDYIGDLDAFAESFRLHNAIARQEGPYKISVHSGSDKFSLYPIVARVTGGVVHLKTSGTSYLEALRVAARKSPDLFREIAKHCAEVFEEQRASYHIDATLDRFPDPGGVADTDLEGQYLVSPEADAARQVLHVCFGSVLSLDGGRRFSAPLKALLKREPAEYAEALTAHLGKHLVAFRG